MIGFDGITQPAKQKNISLVSNKYKLKEFKI